MHIVFLAVGAQDFQQCEAGLKENVFIQLPKGAWAARDFDIGLGIHEGGKKETGFYPFQKGKTGFKKN